MTAIDPRCYRPSEFLKHAASAGVSEPIGRRVLSHILNAHEDFDRSRISREARSLFFPLSHLTLESHVRSERDQFEKLLFRTADNLVCETVLIPLERAGCVTICLSSQIGCVMGCAFCATARMSSRRNLSAWEIVDQFVQARSHARLQRRRVTGVVFMGMGEPFLNYRNVLTAAQQFCFPLSDAISAKAITVSTVGLVPEIERFTDENHPYRLSISIGAATDEKRSLLVPVAARYPITAVAAAARRYATSRRSRVNIAYVCVGGLNTGSDDARALGQLFADVPIRLDLIDVNDSSGRFSPPGDDERNRFLDALREHVAQPVVRRYSGGADIRAACGTLAGAV